MLDELRAESRHTARLYEFQERPRFFAHFARSIVASKRYERMQRIVLM